MFGIFHVWGYQTCFPAQIRHTRTGQQEQYAQTQTGKHTPEVLTAEHIVVVFHILNRRNKLFELSSHLRSRLVRIGQQTAYQAETAAQHEEQEQHRY